MASRKNNKAQPGESLKTTDHETIREWVEERGGRPAAVKSTKGGDDPGLLRIDFPQRGAEDSLEEVSGMISSRNSKKRNLPFYTRRKLLPVK